MRTLNSPKLRIRISEPASQRQAQSDECLYTAISFRTCDGELDLAVVEDKPGKDQAKVRQRAFLEADKVLVQAQLDLRKLAKLKGVTL